MDLFDRGKGDGSFQKDMAEMGRTSGTRRVQGDCTECGEVEGSVILLVGTETKLCTPCYNDPDVLGTYV